MARTTVTVKQLFETYSVSSTSELAKLLGVTSQAVSKWKSRGHVPRHHLDGTYDPEKYRRRKLQVFENKGERS